MNNLNKLSENKFFIWACAGIVFLGLAALKNDFIFSNSLVSRIADQVQPSIEPQKLQLDPAPKTVKAVYLTGWSAGNPKKIQEIIGLAKTTEINGVVIDVKDYLGKVFFETESELIRNIGSIDPRIKNFGELVKKLHQENIYVAVRIAVFQDLFLAERRPEYAVKNSLTGKIWRDNKNLAWVDPGSKYVWDYNIEIAREAIRLGVDEVNFDYIRFPSDGAINQLEYSFYKTSEKTKAEQLQEFFAYLHENLKDRGAKLSVDLFGLSTINTDDLGIGQVIEYAFPYFDYVSPMVYPSHYASGFLKYKNPAAYPYEVIDYSMEKAIARRSKLDFELNQATSTATTSLPYIKISRLPKNTKLAEIRPWLQVFNLGADYTPEMVRKEIQAVYDNGLGVGWYLWNPSNIYNQNALLKE